MILMYHAVNRCRLEEKQLRTCNPAPTSALLITTLIPHCLSSAAGPIPESFKSIGVLIAPAERMTSVRAKTLNFGAMDHFSVVVNIEVPDYNLDSLQDGVC